MKRNFLLLHFTFYIFNFSFSQSVEVYPSNWWVGMKWNKVQLMLHYPAIGSAKNFSVPKSGIQLVSMKRVENKNYLFLDLLVDPKAKPGKYRFSFQPINNGDSSAHVNFDFELKPRRPGNGTAFAQGVASKDFIYLLMPDRFSDGDTTNDRVEGMRDQALDRSDIFARHGGDLQGVINHLDYLKALGITTLWMTPVVENDMPNRTEHGYACTNQYKIDPRLGSAALYKKLSDELHKRGMKLIQDVVYNHMGAYNFLQLDPPMKDWVHQWPTYTNPNYKDQTLFDPYAAEVDKQKQLNGWFPTNPIGMMPDLNQSNPYVANFLIQNAIWCVEEFGVDGWRIDTYIYVDPEFMNRCNKALIDEYPRMTMFGEAWVHSTVSEAYFTRNNLNVPFKSNATGVCDFQCLFDGIQPALMQDNGVEKLYQTLSNDMLYKDPMNNVIFLDNHDMTRFYSQVKEDTAKLKMGIAWLLTERGTPEMYYGTEILLSGISNPDGKVRQDFPGGWPSDKMNKFTKEGRTKEEESIFEYTKRLANFRKNSSAITTGKMTQYVPEKGVYVYFRYDAKQTLMCVMNTNDSISKIDLSRFKERIKDFRKGHEVATGTTFDFEPTLTVPGKNLLVIELRK